MKRMLLLLAAGSCLTAGHAQDSKKTTAYAITGVQKGSSSWTEVRLVNINTGEELQSVYQSSQTVEPLNARTGKPIVKKDMAVLDEQGKETRHIQMVRKDASGNVISIERRVIPTSVLTDKPFATNSAALAFDKKHNRLYYTPMGINQLRYIDLKSGQIYYFEDENFGSLKSRHDLPNQVTRMVIASDGNGYALTNDGNHLIQFTTGKKPKIQDLGAITDDASNGAFSIHSREGYGGDLIADAQNHLYLITANRNVFKISLDTKQGIFLGAIRGLPKGFSTNGAAVEAGSKVIVSSSTLTQAYYRFDLNTLQAEKISEGASVFNASDLANGNLAFDKKKKERKDKEIRQANAVSQDVQNNQKSAKDAKPRETVLNETGRSSIAVYPNPVTNGLIRLSFNDQPAGRYVISFMDVTGKIISQQLVDINSKVQVVEYRLPGKIAAGNYMVRVTNETKEVASMNKLVVQ